MRRKRPEPPQTAYQRYSATKINALVDCPFRCFLDSILRIPAPLNPMAAFGQAIHEMARKRLTPDRRTKRCPYEEIGAFLGAWKGHWWGAVNGRHGFDGRRKPPQVVVWESEEQPGDLFGWGNKVLKIFHEKYVDLSHDGKKHFTEKDFTIPNWHGFTISGRIDRLDIEEDGVVIVDYKNGKYPTHLLETGFQMTIYQLAYEECLRRRIPGHPPLKEIQIYDYAHGKIQTAPLRGGHEFGILLTFLVEASEYLRAILTGSEPRKELVSEFKFFKEKDIICGDISPRLPRGNHCVYCSHFKECREWEFGRWPKPRELFLAKHELELAAFQPTQIRMPLSEDIFVVQGAQSFQNLQNRTFPLQLHLRDVPP